MWDFSPVWIELQELGQAAILSSPFIAISIVLLAVTWFAARWSVRLSSAILRRRLDSPLLRDVAARAVAVPVFLLGLYVVLRVSGLTGLAVSVLGGAGLIGLVVGFAFRDIAENFLASILIGMQHPFANGDLIEVGGFKGFVQSVNTRSTTLMTLEGNHVQIPNATIYKNTIINFTANPFARFDFVVGIGYDDSIKEAQAVALKVLGDHPAVIDDPEPLVLVDALAASTVNLRVYFWVDIQRYSQFKVRSAVMRLTKVAFDQAGISMPDEAREVVFPRGVPVEMVGHAPSPTATSLRSKRPGEGDDDRRSAGTGEGDLSSEADEIARQARSARKPEGGTNLLEDR